jgi:hypothetical protein
MELEKLYQRAASIPSMGGTEIGPLLREYARKVPDHTAVVEVGCWLGAGTAQLALGIRERHDNSKIRIYCYDRWIANEAEIEKATSFGLTLQPGEDLLPHMQNYLEPFEIPIEYHQGDLREATWNGEPISLYVDDASKRPKLFFHSLRTFGPSWKPGETIIFLMDYDIWTKTGEREHECQKEFIEAHLESFERIPHPEVAIFRYRSPVNFENWIEAKISSTEWEDVERLAQQLDKGERAAVIKMTQALKRARLAIERQDDQITKLQNRLAERDKKIRGIESSTSWRITAPLRTTKQFLRGLIKKDEQPSS